MRGRPIKRTLRGHLGLGRLQTSRWTVDRPYAYDLTLLEWNIDRNGHRGFR